ncbi:unnamed protein product [Ilex paraguariensis]|uniref:RING-type E3 ubiquitin transferase n=1 Tax=Ilex paraguariensis TaxID=185542 RepID=A0ABC8SS75_9AQUA
MDSSSSTSRRRLYAQTHIYPMNRQKSISKRIAKAIIGRSCPICFTHIDDREAAVITVCMHAYCIDCISKWSSLKPKCPLCNAEFDSWFCGIDLSSGTFHQEKLPLVSEGKSDTVYGRRRDRLAEQRVIRRSRGALNNDSWRTKPLQRQRSFGQSRFSPPDVIAERIMHWRVSIYKRGLQAVPCAFRSVLQQNVIGNSGFKERMLQRIEPWIRRELQGILGDPDPSIIVHVAASLFISSLEEKHTVPSGQFGVEDNYLEPLRPFLFEWTKMFWHELRCFAESSFTIDTYDTVVEYKLIG